MSTRPITIAVEEDGHRLTLTGTPHKVQERLAQVKCLPRITLKKARAAALRPAEKRVYPKYYQGMSTAQYVVAYSKANRMSALTPDDQFFQPLSDTPQFPQSGEVIEESL